MAFVKAVRTKSKARVVVVGPSKSGKSMTALRIARGLVGKSGRIAARDSEAGSLSKYAALPGEPETEMAFEFDTDEPRTHSPADYVRAIHEAEAGGYDVIILDSLSHGWTGIGGVLEIVDNSGADKFTSGWKKASPLHNLMLDAINGSSIHVIATLRTKMEYVLEMVKGKQVPRKVGMGPVQRDGVEYEFDLTCTMDREHRLTVDGTRCPDLEEASILHPTQAVGETLAAWLGQGVDAPPKHVPLTAEGRDKMYAAMGSRADQLLEVAVDAGINAAPQDKPSMQDALRAAVKSHLGVEEIPGDLVQEALVAFDLAGLGDDGTISIEVAA